METQDFRSHMHQQTKNERERFRRRKLNLFKKAAELAKIGDAKVYLYVERGRRCSVYASNEAESFPPADHELVC